MRRIPRTLFALALLGASLGCSLIRSPILPETDGGTMDAGRDAAGSDAPGRDAQDTPPDAAFSDGPELDAPDAPLDTGVDAPLDTGVDAPLPATCRMRYGGLSDYTECAVTATSCEFYVALGGSTCAGACASGGGTCLAVYNNGDTGSGRCTRSGTRGCSDGATDRICICSRP